MMDRRGFALGLGSLLLATRAFADIRANGMLVVDDTMKLKDIPETRLEDIPNHRQMMRDIVVELSAYAKARNPRFIVLARDAQELLVKESREWEWETSRDADGTAAGKYTPVGSLNRPYLKAIDGMVIDGLFCGRDKADQPTDAAAAKLLLDAVAKLQQEGRRALAIDYCKSSPRVAAVGREAARAKVLSYVERDGGRRLDHIPSGTPTAENARHVTDLAQARNFLPMLSSQSFGSRDDWVTALAATNYDLLLLDAFWRGSEPLTADDVKTLKMKRLGSRRLVLADLPVGRAADSRFYWKKDWKVGTPSFLEAPDAGNPAQMVVRYWESDWKALAGSYMQGIVDLGFDGVMLDYLDVYLYFEQMMPLR
jgi:endo-alpha-1,4-polygalactosaminidase (GH114 family)